MATTRTSAAKTTDAAGRRTKTKGEAPKAALVEKDITNTMERFAEYVQTQTGYAVDVRSLQLGSVLRGEFQKSDENQQYLAARAVEIEAEQAAKVQRAEEREARRAEREAAKAAKAAEPKAATTKAPAAKKAVATKTAAKAPAAKATPVKKAVAKPAATTATKTRRATKPAATDPEF
jgi:hypothetical protein